MLGFFMWGADPTAFTLLSREVRWYGILFALSFICAQYILTKIYKDENVDVKLLDKFAIYAVLGTVLGARLGHCLFYEPEHYLSNPLDILKIWEGGLASHGATLGLLISTYLFYRKYKVKSYAWTLDMLAIVVALAGFFVRTGNFFNSEIIGKPTTANVGVVFYNRSFSYLEEHLAQGDFLQGDIDVSRTNQDLIMNEKMVYAPLKASLEVSSAYNDQTIKDTIRYTLFNFFDNRLNQGDQMVIYPKDLTISVVQKGTKKIANFEVLGIPRHPTQLYEAFTSLVLFILMIALYKPNRFQHGFFVGLFFIWTFGLRFVHEFFKENQVAKEEDMFLNLGQLLSIPLVLAGIYLMARALINQKKNREV